MRAGPIFILLLTACAAQPLHENADPLHRLEDGNRRFASGAARHPHQTSERRSEVSQTQHPFAVVLSCADSRVAPEIVFDQGLGDLFVVRVAGNIADDPGLASIEYAVDHLHASLVVVMGHQRCGAVDAALHGGPLPGHLPSLTKEIGPAVAEAQGMPGDVLDNAVRANVRRVVRRLKDSLHHPDLIVVGAYYDLDTGRVEFMR